MLRWHMTFERKLVERPARSDVPYHRQHSNPPDRIESPPPCPDNSRFFQHNPPIADLYTTPPGFPQPTHTSGLLRSPAWTCDARITGIASLNLAAHECPRHLAMPHAKRTGYRPRASGSMSRRKSYHQYRNRQLDLRRGSSGRGDPTG